MRRNISTLLAATTLLFGIPRLATAQTPPPPGYQALPPPGYQALPPPRYQALPYADSPPLPTGAMYPGTTPYAAALDEDGDPPPGYHVETHARRGLVIAGSIVFGATYLLGLAASSNQDSSSPSGYLVIPVLGPWIALANLGGYDEAACDSHASSDKICPSKEGASTAYKLLGVGQLTGIALFTAGFVFRSSSLVPDSLAKNELVLAPMYAGNVPSGLSLAGRF